MLDRLARPRTDLRLLQLRDRWDARRTGELPTRCSDPGFLAFRPLLVKLRREPLLTLLHRKIERHTSPWRGQPPSTTTVPCVGFQGVRSRNAGWNTDAVKFIGGEHLWDRMRALSAGAVQRRVAVAYAGRNAAELLPLSVNDTVVVDGGDGALAAGSTHPGALATWLRAGAYVWSLPGLHAKVVLLEDASGARTAIVGSANISDRSNSQLIEAAVTTDDHDVCQSISDEMDRWVGMADPVDAEWLKRARTLYREPKQPDRAGGRRRGPRLDRRAPLWVGMSTPAMEPLSPAAEAEYRHVVQDDGRGADVQWWQLNDGDEGSVLPGHNIILVNNPSDRDEPVGQATAWGPAKVVRVVPGSKRHRPVAILVRDPKLARYRFSHVRATITGAGTAIDWERPLDARAAAALYRMWSAGDAGHGEREVVESGGAVP
ncbi:phospholipase D family protein [Dactylosporangium sp. CA-139114]|uniref:phospholipase D family protein n=1 Tax=Dactylosporangium sp. CA-139114 TaxID=3239931 RepID=UPI003D98B5C6